MSFTPVTITHDFDMPDQAGAVGVFEYGPVDELHNGAQSIAASPRRKTLTSTGGLSITVPATTDVGTYPPGVPYRFTVRITGEPARTYYAPVPHNQGATIDLGSLLDWVAGGYGSSPLGSTGTAISVDGVLATELDIDSSLITAADVDALPDTGGTVTGNLRIQDPANSKAYRFVTSGSGVPLYYEVGGENLVLRTNSGADFAGTAREYLRCSKDTQELQAGGLVQFRDSIGGTTVHSINPTDGVAALGGKNGLANLRFCGLKATTGAPATGTWAVGDLVMDSAKAWWRCSVAGTPGTWV